MDDYKGLYYKETKEQKLYEGGAHFPYKELYEILIYLKEEQNKREKEELKEKNKNNEMKKEIEEAYQEFSKVDILDLSGPGEKKWIDAKENYRKK